MSGGPQAISRNHRIALANQIVDRVLTLKQKNILAIGLYGSMARGTDEPYSDIEMLCALRNTGEEYSYEWSYGPGKVEVNFCSQDVLMQMAAEVDVDWPLTHGAYCHVLPLYDPDLFFVKLRDVTSSQPQEAFITTIRGVIVGELYERIGKLRNAQHTGHTAYLPKLAIDLATYGAYLIGLANRHLYTTGARVLEESFALPRRPSGYDALCRMAMKGTLDAPDRIAEISEAFWVGVEEWAADRDIHIEESRRIPF